MSLLQNLSYRDYQNALAFSKEKCEIIAELANIKVTFPDKKNPGEQLMRTLDRSGFTVSQYKHYLAQSLQVTTIITYYRPQAKVAILIANDRYKFLAKLGTPSVDCDSLAANLKMFGFTIVTLKNVIGNVLKVVLMKVFREMPEDSYCFIYYAGHGVELCNTKCMLFIDCPEENIENKHCVTENFVLREVAKCKPELCIFIMDMCRVSLARETNPKIYLSMLNVEEYSIHSNLLVTYSTQSSETAYEVLEIDSSRTIDENVTYELQTGDTDKILPGNSLYVNALCTRLTDNLDIWSLIDKVHGDMENSIRKQKPIKVQCGIAKRSLYDPVKGDTAELLSRLVATTKDIENCMVF